MNRRRFLKLWLLGGAGWVAGCQPMTSLPVPPNTPVATASTSAPQPESATPPAVIIVGAGISGLAAARTLTENGITPVVLEARSRIGGRVWTDRSLGLPLDMGASWIHGTNGNPINAIAQDLNLELAVTDFESYTLYNTDGSELSDTQVANLEDHFDELLEALDAERERRQAAGEPDISLQQAIELVSAGQELDAPLAYLLNTTIEHEYASDLADLSLFNWDASGGFDGDDVIFPNGYDQIVQHLAQGLDIRTEHIVETITIEPDQVRLTTNQGAWSAAHVLVTLPLGVLKSGGVQFSPPLPNSKQQAIARLGVNVLNKVYLKFPQAFWADTDLLGYISEAKGEWAEYVNIHNVAGQPVLLCFNAGAFGTQIEDWTDAEIVAAALDVLRTIYADVPDPEDYAITRWQSDPFARGSYSHFAPGSSPADAEALAEPVGNRLFFAGEATFAEHQATVHGAYLSGFRAAKQIQDLI